MSLSKKTDQSSAMPEAGQGLDENSRAALSKRIWAILIVMIGLLIFTGISMITAKSQLEGITSALQHAQTKAKDSELKLMDALADKEQAMADKQEILREISAQGQRIAESTQGEEKAKAALAVVSSGAQTAEKNIAVRDREIADLKGRLTRTHNKLRKAEGALNNLRTEIATVKTELRFMRTTQESAVAELERLKAEAEPYSQSAGQTGRQPR